MSEEIILEQGHYLLREHDDSFEMYYLKSGILDVYKMKNTMEVKIGEIQKGEIVGEMSFLDKHPRSASIKASTNCTLIKIESAKFDKMLSELPAWYTALINTLLERLRKSNTKIKI